MRFVLSKEFADHVLTDFNLELGSFRLVKAEAVNPDDEAYVFYYGAPYTREDKDKPKFGGSAGWYALYITDHAPNQEYLIKTATEWLGKEPIEVVKCNVSLTEVLLRVDAPGGYWNE